MNKLENLRGKSYLHSKLDFKIIESMSENKTKLLPRNVLNDKWSSPVSKKISGENFFLKIYLFILERESTSGRGKREGQNLKQTPHQAWYKAWLGAWSQDPEIMTWAKIKSQMLNLLWPMCSWENLCEEVFTSTKKPFKVFKHWHGKFPLLKIYQQWDK